jgi:hypothetical protein
VAPARQPGHPERRHGQRPRGPRTCERLRERQLLHGQPCQADTAAWPPDAGVRGRVANRRRRRRLAAHPPRPRDVPGNDPPPPPALLQVDARATSPTEHARFSPKVVAESPLAQANAIRARSRDVVSTCRASYELLATQGVQNAGSVRTGAVVAPSIPGGAVYFCVTRARLPDRAGLRNRLADPDGRRRACCPGHWLLEGRASLTQSGRRRQPSRRPRLVLDAIQRDDRVCAHAAPDRCNASANVTPRRLGCGDRSISRRLT